MYECMKLTLNKKIGVSNGVSYLFRCNVPNCRALFRNNKHEIIIEVVIYFIQQKKITKNKFNFSLAKKNHKVYPMGKSTV